MLQHLGICGNIFTWINNFISQGFSAVKFREATSSFRQTEIGLPQGKVVQSILFSIFINDLPGFLVPTIDSALFADDLVMRDSAVKKSQDSLNKIFNSALKNLENSVRKIE